MVSVGNLFKKDKWIVDSITKPLKAIGCYKVAEIKEICKIMNIETMKNEKKSFTKNELYEKDKTTYNVTNNMYY